jgi:acyl carrier protein
MSGSTVERIERILRDALSIEVPSATTDMIAAGFLDSLALVTLMFEAEQEFHVTVPLANLDIEDLRTVERVAALIDRLGSDGDHVPDRNGGAR